MANASLLVTGASGHLGRRVLELLLEQGHGPLLAVSRNTDTLADLAGRGVELRRADFDDQASLLPAFAGAHRVLLISTDALEPAGRRAAQHRNAVQAAAQAGVRHVLYTSLTRGTASPLKLAEDHAATERELERSSLGYSVLRNNIYMDVLLGTLASGELTSAAGSGRLGYIAREDCARAAAAALASDFEGRRALEVTGPAALSHADVVRIASEALGRPVRLVSVSADDLERGMTERGVPARVAQIFADLDRGVAAGALDVTTSAVSELTGRQPLSFAEFLAGHRRSFEQGAVPANAHV